LSFLSPLVGSSPPYAAVSLPFGSILVETGVLVFKSLAPPLPLLADLSPGTTIPAAGTFAVVTVGYVLGLMPLY